MKCNYLKICASPETGQKKGSMLVLFPDTRFSYADLMLYQFEHNISHLLHIVSLPSCRTTITRGASDQ